MGERRREAGPTEKAKQALKPSLAPTLQRSALTSSPQSGLLSANIAVPKCQGAEDTVLSQTSVWNLITLCPGWDYMFMFVIIKRLSPPLGSVFPEGSGYVHFAHQDLILHLAYSRCFINLLD